MDAKHLTLVDPETNVSYLLVVNEDDYERATQDEHFASSLLHHAKASNHNDVQQATLVEDNDESTMSSEPADTLAVENDNIDNTSGMKTTYVWSYDQVLAVINSMGNHFAELDDPKKRKDVYEHVANDLVSLRYEVNATMVQNKWKSLVKSYRNARDAKKRTGRGPSRFHFYDVMDSLLGADPTNTSSHSINSHDAPVPKHATSVANVAIELPSVSDNNNNTDDDGTNIKDDLKMKTTRTSEKKLKHQYVMLKKEEYAKRDQRHQEKMTLETRKLDLFERFLNSREQNHNE